jgi:periplasmic protein TonB
MFVPVSKFPVPNSFKNSAVAFVVVASHAFVLWTLQQGTLNPAKAVERSKPMEIVIPITLKQILPIAPVKPPKSEEPDLKPSKSPAKTASAVQTNNAPVPSPAPEARIEKSTVEPPAISVSAVAAAASIETSASTFLATSVATAESSKSASVATTVTATRYKPIKVSPSTVGGELSDANKIYPVFSKRLGEQGSVYIRFFVNAEGTAENTEVERSSGFERLDQAALAFVQQSRYKPGTLDGVPTRMLFARNVTYILEK